MTRPMLRRPATGCWCGPATSGGPPGGYTYLPLGKLVPDRNAELAREEMATIRRVPEATPAAHLAHRNRHQPQGTLGHKAVPHPDAD
jgi:hypothetical protein